MPITYQIEFAPHIEKHFEKQRDKSNIEIL